MPVPELDATDRRILRELQQDGALRNDLLAERIALSPAPTLRRVRALESAGGVTNLVKYWPLLESKPLRKRFVLAHVFLLLALVVAVELSVALAFYLGWL